MAFISNRLARAIASCVSWHCGDLLWRSRTDSSSYTPLSLADGEATLSSVRDKILCNIESVDLGKQCRRGFRGFAGFCSALSKWGTFARRRCMALIYERELC
jgi:hypothetical protein